MLHLSTARTREETKRRSDSPPWIRRGGRDLKKMSRSLRCGSGRGGSFKLPIIGGLNQPPRLRELMRLREIFLIAQPPLLSQGGECAPITRMARIGNGALASALHHRFENIFGVVRTSNERPR